MTYANAPGQNSEEIMDEFNSADSLNEISGMTTGEFVDGTSVTVALADKNNAGDRNGTGAIEIAYTDTGGTTQHHIIDFAPDDQDALLGVGFEDMDWRDDGTNGGKFYLIDEGGGKNGDYSAPTIYIAQLTKTVTKTNDGVEEVHHQMQLVGKSITLDVPENEYSTSWGNKTTNPYGKANGAEGLAVDKDGNIYVGMQSGNIYKGTLQDDGDYSFGTEPIIKTGYNDLSAMDFDSDGNLVIGFGSNSYNQVDGGDNNNHVITYSRPDSDGKWPEKSNSNTKVEGLADLEAIYEDDNQNIIAGSDNGGKKAENVVKVDPSVNTTINT